MGWQTWLRLLRRCNALQIFLAFFTLASSRWEMLLLVAASFPIYVKALATASSGREQKWHVTGATT